MDAISSFVQRSLETVGNLIGIDGTMQQTANDRDKMKIHIWYHDSYFFDTGEASIQLPNGKYYSFRNGFNGSLTDDTRAEGKPPNKTIKIGHLALDAQKIENWLTHQMKNKTMTLLGTYSCWVVYAALTEGGSKFSPNPMWSPGILFRYLRRIQEGYSPMIKKFPDSPLI